MKRIFNKLSLGFTSWLLLSSAAYSSSSPNTDDPNTFLGPTARIGFTSTLTDYAAYNIAGEAGLKDFRLGGTMGWKLTENQLFKLSTEYLLQRITYAFFSGDLDKWVQQGAVGAAYQYELAEYRLRPQFDLSAYVSRAPSVDLSSVSGIFMQNGMSIPFTDNRRIAGSNGAGISPGLAIMPWRGGRLSAALNYDRVRYDTKTGSNQDALGLGGTIGFNQAITDSLGIGLAAAVRQPFNNYAANISWDNANYLGQWSLGLFGDYTAGKNTLPDTYNVGLSVIYFLDQRLKGENLKGDPVSDNLLAWTAQPAVYLPQVLSIVDPNVITPTPPCPPGALPKLISSIPNITVPFGGASLNVDESVHFSGSNLIFSLVSVAPVNPNITVSSTGVLQVRTGSIVFVPYTVVIQASNACGSVLSNPFTYTLT